MSGGQTPGATSAGSERGSTLTELLVVMLIMGFIVSALAALTIGFQKTSAQNVARQNQIEGAREGVERVSKTVRTAVKPIQMDPACASCSTFEAFEYADAFTVKFYANLDNPGGTTSPSKVSYTVSGTGSSAGQLIETILRPNAGTPLEYCNPEAAGASADCRSRFTKRVIARGVQVDPTSPLFKYYDTLGAARTPTATGLASGDLPKVLAIEVTLRVRDSQATSAPTTYIQRVTMPNSQSVIRVKGE